MEFDVASAVQDWADGTRANRGFRIRDMNDLVFPYAIRFRLVSVESLEYWKGTGRRPQLYLEIADVPAPTLDFRADPTRIALGESSTLRWQTTNAISCHATTRNWVSLRMGTSGAVQVSPHVAASYGLGCTGPGGEVEKTVTVTVPEPGAAAAGLGGLVALGVLVARPRRRLRFRRAAACAASMLAAALASGAAHATALPDPFPSRAVQEAALASDGTRLVVFLRSYLYDWVLPGRTIRVCWSSGTGRHGARRNPSPTNATLRTSRYRPVRSR